MSYMRATERKHQILECAKKVFAELGYHSAQIADICREAGIGRGTLYQYFENKKAVFTALLREVLDTVERLMRERKQPRLPEPESITRRQFVAWNSSRLREVLERVFADERTLRIVLREAVGLDLDVEGLLHEIDAGMISIVAEDLDRAIQAGLVRDDIRPSLTATLMVGGVEKMALAALRGDGEIDLDTLTAEATRLHCIGIISHRVSEAE